MRRFIVKVGRASYEFLLLLSKYKFFVVLIMLLLILAGIFFLTSIMEDYNASEPLM